MSPLEDALALAGEGLPVFACEPRGKRPLGAAAPHGCKDATTDVDQIRETWRKYPDANVGVATGSGIMVVDIDGDEGALSLADLRDTHGPLPATRTVRTGKGMHFYYLVDNADVKNTAKKLAPGIDTRGTGGYVIAAGTHPSGNPYESDGQPIARAPQWLIDALVDKPAGRAHLEVVPSSNETTAYGRRALEDEAERVSRAPEGTGNDTLNQAAFALGQLEAGGEIAYGEAQRVLEDAADSWERRDSGARKTIASGLNAGRAEPRRAPERINPQPRSETVTKAQVESETAPARLTIESWNTFRDKSPEEITYLVNGLVPEGSLTFIAGAPKAGKTWIGLALAVSVATGRPFLGRFTIPTAEPVLYFALEGHRAAIRARVGSITRGTGRNPDDQHDLSNLHVVYRPIGLDLGDGTWAHEVETAVKTTGAKLVMVDVLRAAAPRLRESGEGAGDFNGIRAGLAPLLANGVTIGLLHHFIKAGEASKARSIGERMSGSGALFGHADLVLGITGKDPMNMRVELMGRDNATPDPFNVQLEGTGSGEFGGFTYRDTLYMRAVDDYDGEPWEHTQKVVQYIRDRGESVKPGEITSKFGIASQTLRDHRGDLQKLGITYVDKGRFSTYHAPNTDSTG